VVVAESRHVTGGTEENHKTSEESRCFGRNLNQGYPYSNQMLQAINQDVRWYAFS